MFGRIAHRYDLTNRILSGGIDVYWRFRLVEAVRRVQPTNVLDLATGSGDVALALARALPAGRKIVGMDFCAPMLAQAEVKQAGRKSLASQVVFQQGDALDLPLGDGTFDVVTMAFGFRNMADRARCLKEIRRVLRPGGTALVLEFSQPWAWVRPFYYFHMRHLAPLLAGPLTGDRSAYEYLCTSIKAFPGRDAVSEEFRAAGFDPVSATTMTMGIVALHRAQRQADLS
jgi:demethylmenaquinone methyltransferase/2-methoxy-6-polyprenyl-1,4-benzoquinol methylase